MGENNVLNELINKFTDESNNPHLFLSSQHDHVINVQSILKKTYDFTKNQEVDTSNSNALPELIVKDFDVEQIWQQIELQNDGILADSAWHVSKFVAARNRLAFDEVQNAVDDEEENYCANEVDDDDNEADYDDNEADYDDNEADYDDNEVDDDDDDEINDELEEASDNEDEDIEEAEEKSDELMNSDFNSEEEDEQKSQTSNRKYKKSVVDDDFFKLDEMEEFLRSEEKKMENEEPDSGNDSNEDDDMEDNNDDDDDDEIDLFNEDMDDMETNVKERGGLMNPKYADFFVANKASTSKGKKKKKLLDELEEEADEAEDEEEANEAEEGEEDEEDEQDEIDENQQKSAFELRQERLKKRIDVLEKGAVAERPWQLMGEVTAEGRPVNSLLEEYVDVDIGSRPAPVMTEQTSLLLEDIIKQRIKDKVFDSVVRKEKHIETPLEYKKKLVLNQEKSKESLAQIYEKEYLQQKEALNPEFEEKEEEEPALHKEVRTLMSSLFRKLDALSNLHYTPKQAQPELKIVSNLPAINMEEVAPVATTDAAMLAPEEVKGKKRSNLLGKSERTTTDKKRERRKKKQFQRKHVKEQEKRAKIVNQINPGLGNKYSKAKMDKELKDAMSSSNVQKLDENKMKTKSSTAFFQQLQDEVSTQVKSKPATSKGKDKNSLSAKKLKL